jgi:hypothetical protein
MLKALLGSLPTKTLQNIINICAHQLLKRKYWREITSPHPELFIPQGFAIIISKTEKWEWKVKDDFGNELSHGISPTEHMAILDGHLWIELLENDKCNNNTQTKNTKLQ